MVVRRWGGLTLPVNIIKDSEFTNPAAWEDSIGTVTGGLLVIENANGNMSPIYNPASVIGKTYTYNVVIESYTEETGYITYGGVKIWQDTDGAGEFSGTVVPTSTAGLVITASGPLPPFLGGTYSVDKIEIIKEH